MLEDQEFLGRIMMLNEEIDECETMEDLKEKENNLKNEMNTIIKNLTKFFANENYKAIVNELIKMRFCKRALERIDNKERELI